MKFVLSNVCLGLLLLCTTVSLTTGQPQSVCGLPSVTGPCRGYFRRYYYDAAEGKCKLFVYGGCRGNGNNFKTKGKCNRVCGGSSNAVNVCSLPQAAGLCRAYKPSFFYNSASKQCESFVYGGCGGNANRFPTQWACQNVCGGSSNLCQQPKVVGMCRAAFPRWYFDAGSGSCQQFTYGGCGGNGNNFLSLQQCMQTCVSQ